MTPPNPGSAGGSAAPNPGIGVPAAGGLTGGVPTGGVPTGHHFDEPTNKELGEVGAWYFRRQPTWVARQVETLSILDPRTAERSLTIDLVLPRDPHAQVQTSTDRAMFCVPVARLSKEKPASFMDFRDERGRALPLLTRAEAASISRRALGDSVQRLLGNVAIDPILGRSLAAIVEDDAPRSDIGVAIYRKAMLVRNQLRHGSEATRLWQVVNQLQANSFVWVLLVGRPGEHRVVKLKYRIPLRTPVIPARKQEPEWIEALDYELPFEGPVDWLATAQNLIARSTISLGWDAIDLRLTCDSEDTDSYHFQVHTPDGLRLDDIVREHAQNGDPVPYVDENHLYLKGAARGQPLRLLLRLRVVRRGLLNLSLLASLVISALLWLVWSHRGHLAGPGSGTHAQIAAATLLVVPAIMIAWATRPAENPLASALLAGVRFCVFLTGVCAALGAAAVGDVPFAGSVSRSLVVCATASSLATAAIAVGWLGTMALVRENVARARRMLWGDRRHGVSRFALATVSLGTIAGASALMQSKWHSIHAESGWSDWAGILAIVLALLLYVLRRRASEPGAEDTIAPASATFGYTLAVVIVALWGVDAIVGVSIDQSRPVQIGFWVCLIAAGIAGLGFVVSVLAPLAEPDDSEALSDWEAVDRALELIEAAELENAGAQNAVDAA